MIRKYGVWIFKLFPTLIYLYILSARLSRNLKKYSRMIRYKKMRKIIQKGNRVFGVDYIIDGYDSLKVEQSYVITPNHQSMIDPILFIDIMEDPTAFIAKSDLEKKPYAGNGIRSVDGLFIDRGNLRKEVKTMKALEESLLKDNLRWVIFPEGTRTKDKDLKLNEFKAGTFKAPQKCNKNIVPVAIYGSFRVLKTNYHWKKYPVQISFLKPITPDEYKDMTTVEIAKLVQDRIEARINELRERDNELVKNYQK